MQLDLDSLFAEVELETGLPPALVAVRYPLARVPSVFVVQKQKPPRWTEAEESFLRDNLGQLTFAEIAARLGRSENAVKIRQVRQQIPTPSKRPGWLTGQQVARVLGVDIHAIMLLVSRDWLPMTRLPGPRGILTIRQITLYRWAVNPERWPYFIHSVRDTRRITDPHLRRLIERQKGRWDDEWWSIGQVAAWHGVDHTDVNRYIHHGKIAAFDYGNWWIKRSEATRPTLKFHKGKGSAMIAIAGAGWTPAADAYILRARAEGLTWAEIGRRMKVKQKAVDYRGRILLAKIQGGKP